MLPMKKCRETGRPWPGPSEPWGPCCKYPGLSAGLWMFPLILPHSHSTRPPGLWEVRFRGWEAAVPVPGSQTQS